MSDTGMRWLEGLEKTADGNLVFPMPTDDDSWRRLRRVHQKCDAKGQPRKNGAVRVMIQESEVVTVAEDGTKTTAVGLIRPYWLSWGVVGGDTTTTVLYPEDIIAMTDLWETALSAWRTRYTLDIRQKYVHAVMAGPTTPEGLEKTVKIGKLAKVEEENASLKARLAAMEEMLKKLTADREEEEEE